MVGLKQVLTPLGFLLSISIISVWEKTDIDQSFWVKVTDMEKKSSQCLAVGMRSFSPLGKTLGQSLGFHLRQIETDVFQHQLAK